MKDWKPIKQSATEAAEKMGHKLGPFESVGGRRNPGVRTAMCETCYGCCWVAWNGVRGFGAGGRLLKYRCGTAEAAGLLAKGAGGVA